MRPEALAYLSTQNICVLAVEMPDGSPHGATVHFAHTDEPFQCIFLTERGYKKAEPFLQKEVVRASVVVGTQEGEMKTVQMDGTAMLTKDQALIDAYYKKFANKNRASLTDEDVFIVFTPTWWRFTDWTPPEGKTTFDSTGKVVAVGN